VTTAVVRPIDVRRVHFTYPEGRKHEHFVGGDLVMSHLVAFLSSIFPEGEDFFIRSVRDHRDRISDPDLQQAIRGFIGQEVTDGREHRALNERLQAMGYPTRRTDRHIRRLLKTVDRVVPRLWALAATAALEHYTATFAEILLTDERAQAMVGPESEVRPLLFWHALEESEHKAVAFDVYKAAGGPEWLRMAAMDLASLIFWSEVVVQTTLSLAADRATYNPVRLAKSLNELRRSPFFDLAAIRRYRSYQRVGFHPDDWDATDVIERWSEELADLIS